MLASHKKSVIQTIKTVLSAGLACSEADLFADGVSIRVAEIREGRFRFPVREQPLSIVTMGKGVVISCSPERMEWVRQNLGHLSRGQIFSIQTSSRIDEYVRKDNQFIAGPDQKYVCSMKELAEYSIPDGVNISNLDHNNITNLYKYTNFRHALSYQSDNHRPDRLATIAEYDGKIVGIAGASEDCDLMWQIGVDVLPEYQGLGIGKAVVGTLTKTIMNEGVVPYYSAEISNLHSRQLAVSLGYWPAWIQLYAR